MNERMKFVMRLEDGERMSDLCKEFGISRKTGYKIWNRYRDKGVDGFFDESKAPIRTPHATKDHIVKIILDLKGIHKTWGADKLREYLKRKYPSENFPSVTTFHNILLRHDLVKKRRRRRFKATGTNLRATAHSNDLWCADFKGQFKMRNKRYCYPLTITDHYSRYLIGCDALESTKEGGAFAVFEQAFKEFGLPHAIRTDNGVPFSSPKALLGLSKLSVWWLRLGIEIERIRPGHPQENGRHERMHLTLKQDICKNPAKNILEQQELLDGFKHIYNDQRPHAGIEQKIPSDLYVKAERELPQQLPELNYNGSELDKTVNSWGKIAINRRSISISEVLAGQPIGLFRIEENILRVQFMDLVIGHIDDREYRFSPMREFFKV